MTAIDSAMISDRLFVYGTLMRGFDHPMAKLLSRSADFLGEAAAAAGSISSSIIRGWCCRMIPPTSCSANCIACASATHCSREFDMYEACGAGFPEPTEYLRQMLQVTLADGTASEAWTYVYNWPVTGLPRIASGRFLEHEFSFDMPGMTERSLESSRTTRTSTSRST